MQPQRPNCISARARLARPVTAVGSETANSQDVIDHSGRISRRGYQYQDLCALRYCIDMVGTGRWHEVWCESHDDFVLVVHEEEGDRYRLAQVKYRSNAGTHWGVASLVPLKKGTNTPNEDESVLIKLFAGDQHPQKTEFRLLFNEGVQPELRPFAYRWKQAEPEIDIASEQVSVILRRLAGWSPSNGRDVVSLVANLGIESHASTVEEMEAALILELNGLLTLKGIHSLTSEIENLLWVLYRLVYKAAGSDPNAPGSDEKITRKMFEDQVQEHIGKLMAISEQATDPGKKPGDVLTAELEDLGLSGDYITEATHTRQQFFLRWRRRPSTAQRAATDEGFREIRAFYLLEKGVGLADPGDSPAKQFSRVLRRVSDMADTSKYQEHGLTLDDLMGMLFYMMARQQLRFRD